MDRDEVIALANKFDMRRSRASTRRPRVTIAPPSQPALATRSDVEAAARLYDERLARASAYARRRRRDGKGRGGEGPETPTLVTNVQARALYEKVKNSFAAAGRSEAEVAHSVAETDSALGTAGNGDLNSREPVVTPLLPCNVTQAAGVLNSSEERRDEANVQGLEVEDDADVRVPVTAKLSYERRNSARVGPQSMEYDNLPVNDDEQLTVSSADEGLDISLSSMDHEKVASVSRKSRNDGAEDVSETEVRNTEALQSKEQDGVEEDDPVVLPLLPVAVEPFVEMETVSEKSDEAAEHSEEATKADDAQLPQGTEAAPSEGESREVQRDYYFYGGGPIWVDMVPSNAQYEEPKDVGAEHHTSEPDTQADSLVEPSNTDAKQANETGETEEGRADLQDKDEAYPRQSEMITFPVWCDFRRMTGVSTADDDSEAGATERAENLQVEPSTAEAADSQKCADVRCESQEAGKDEENVPGTDDAYGVYMENVHMIHFPPVVEFFRVEGDGTDGEGGKLGKYSVEEVRPLGMATKKARAGAGAGGESAATTRGRAASTSDDDMNNDEEPVAMRFLSRADSQTTPTPTPTPATTNMPTDALHRLSVGDNASANDSDVEATPRAGRLNLADIASSPTTPSAADAGAEDDLPSPTDKQKVELVEIKPRRRTRTTAYTTRASGAQPSAFDGTPAAEVYDPAWGGNKFRVEGGQLRDRRDGNRPRAPVLPRAFRPEGVPDDETELALEEAERQALLVRADETNAAARRGANALIVEGLPFTAAEALAKVLRVRFDADSVVCKGGDVRASVPIDGAPRMLVVRCTPHAGAGAGGGTTLSFRRSLLDRSKLTHEAFERWIGDVRDALDEIQH